MNWTPLTTIVELTGAVAVIFTLVYLAIQTRQNGNAIKANTRQAILASDQELLSALRDDPELEVMRFKSSLTDLEKIRLSFLYLTFARMRESNWFQYQHGVLDQNTWESYRNSLVVMFCTPNGMKWWANYTSRPGILSQSFISMSNELLEKAPMITESRPLSAFD